VKRKIVKLLGVVLSLALLSSLAMVAAPVTAAPGTNAFGKITLPAVAPGTDVELIATAADGTLFASVYKNVTGDDWIIYKSTDSGWTWTATKFSHNAAISAIVCAPNWDSNDTFYVGTADGQVYRCTDAGVAEPILLRQIVDSTATEATVVWDMDLWTDGDSMWILVATDIDVLVMEDTLFAEWVDMDLTISFDGTHTSYNGTPQDLFSAAYVCRFAPDFDQSGLVWTVVADGTINIYTLGASSGNSAAWSTAQKVSGNYSALLTYVSGDNAYVEFTPAPGITVSDLATITNTSFWYYLSASNGPLMELRFTEVGYDPSDGWGHVDITIDDAELSPTTDAWTEVPVTSSSSCIYFGNDPTDGTAFFDNTSAETLAGVAAAIDVQAAMTAGGDSAADWELTRVRIEIGWIGSARTCYIDDVTIAGVNYDLETGGDAWITATISPGQWGQVVNSVEIIHDGSGSLRNEIDLDFADHYSSTSAPILFAAMNFENSETGDGLFLIEGGFGVDSSIATSLEVGGTAANIDFQSVQVSGEVIMAGEYWNANVWISLNGGDTFAEATKPPTGTGQTHLLMAPGAFDPDEGVAYAATRGTESAFSYTIDGGDTWNQTAFVDTDIDAVLDLAFGSTILITDDSGGYDSLWRTADITATTPLWERVNCTQISSLDSFGLVEYSMDGSVVMLFGPDGADNIIQKSTDNGQTWNNWRTLPAAIGAINDWVVYDSATIYAACGNGFYGTTRFGPAKQKLTIETLVSIALQPGFDPNDTDNSNVLAGNDAGDAFVSNDGGATWGTGDSVGAGNVYVAFDQLDPTKAYFATSGSIVKKAVLDGVKLKTGTLANLTDSAAGPATADSFSGIWVSPDNALYAIGGDTIVSTTTWGDPSTVATNTITLTGVSSSTATIVTLPVTPITVISSSFTQGTEALTISGAVVTALSSSVAQGTVYVTGGTSSATGSFDILITGLSGYTAGEDVNVTVGTLQSVRISTITSTTEDAYLFRLLLGEPLNIWETEQKDGAIGLWGFSGSNYLLSVVSDDLYGLKDTLSGQVQGVTVSSVGETSAKVNWTNMLGAKQYEMTLIVDGVTSPIDFNLTTPGVQNYVVPSTAKAGDTLSATVTGLTDNKNYSVKVRVATGQTFQSRWSDAVSLKTVESIGMPDNKVPENGMQNAPLLPSFVWLPPEVGTPASYEFELSTSPAYTQAEGFSFSTTVVAAVITAPTTAYTCTVELAYDTDHYWIVRAVSATGTKSDWCFSNFHTRVEPIEQLPPVTILPQPTPTIILPTPTVVIPPITVVPPPITVIPQDITVIPPDVIVNVPPVVLPTPTTTIVQPQIEMPEEVTPIYIWIIVAIGAILTVAVIVLIIRTRRVV